MVPSPGWLDTLIVFFNIPVACAGGVAALLVTHTTFSVSASMGFISIFGVAVQDAILVVTGFQRHRAEGSTIEEAALQASRKWLRPLTMTTLVAMSGLLPATLSRGIGSETQKPLAVVVIGGALTLTFLARLIQPSLLIVAHRVLGRFRRAAAREQRDELEAAERG